MKVLEKCEMPKWNIEKKCTGSGNGNLGCGSKLLIDEDDIFRTCREHYWGETDYYYTFKCPICGENTDISENLIPNRIKLKVMNSFKERNKHLWITQ